MSLMLLSALLGASPGQAQAPPSTIHFSLLCEDDAWWLADGAYISSLEGQWLPMRPSGNPLHPRKDCNAHIGHWTYLVGVDRVYGLRSGWAEINVKEIFPFSPGDQVLGSTTAGSQTDIGVEFPIETSMDGFTWTRAATGRVREVTANPSNPSNTLCHDVTGCSDGQSNIQHYVYVTWTSSDTPFRFLRHHNPESAYTGLSGFTDWSGFEIDVVDLGPVDPINLVQRSGVAKSCETDIMEDITTDPSTDMEGVLDESLKPDDACSFGGYTLQENDPAGAASVGNTPGQWDAPSFFHTYPLGDARLDHIQASVELRQFKTNPSPPSHLVYLEVSTEGEEWERLQTISATLVTQNIPALDGSEQSLYAAEFDWDSDPSNVVKKPAKFVRIVSAPMAGYNTVASDRHPWGFLEDSSLTLEGELP